jgi:hypothetical protein
MKRKYQQDSCLCYHSIPVYRKHLQTLGTQCLTLEVRIQPSNKFQSYQFQGRIVLLDLSVHFRKYKQYAQRQHSA